MKQVRLGGCCYLKQMTQRANIRGIYLQIADRYTVIDKI